MSLGLDLRGGVHFKFQVDLDAAIEQRLNQYIADINKALIDKRIRRNIKKQGNAISIELSDAEDLSLARSLIREIESLIGNQHSKCKPWPGLYKLQCRRIN